MWDNAGTRRSGAGEVVEIGYLLRSVLPIPTGDFQDLPSWRRLVAVTALELPPSAARRPRGTARRIQRDDPTPSHPEVTPRTRAWRLAHLERYGRARRRLATTPHPEIDTTTLPVQDIAALIIKQLGLRQPTSGTDH